ncbi:TetR family transcriptional regulator [Roseomonas sp. GC11]|uniref:TetR/AcrR family transcriptional regulator n=1 Tax=Roseomonas sp. GC11 TaxID=2950546 RepID=UPI00210B8480|nr:TetR family transcriptional regulator [Roseomonas sp. GC11]MCQ4162362.1 TetR family transcriptional regulator [Roseomonas sp. GC11]
MSAQDESTRERILEAARQEFARYGIAGARINRIASEARTSKERLYAHFEDKQALLEGIKARLMEEIAQAVPMEPADLPGYVGRLFDFFQARPELHRIAAWSALEGNCQAAVTPEHPRWRSYAAKLEKIRRAQAEGMVDPGWDPLVLLALLIALAHSWSSAPCEVHILARTHGVPAARFREAAVEATRRLIATRA